MACGACTRGFSNSRESLFRTSLSAINEVRLIRFGTSSTTARCRHTVVESQEQGTGTGVGRDICHSVKISFVTPSAFATPFLEISQRHLPEHLRSMLLNRPVFDQFNISGCRTALFGFVNMFYNAFRFRAVEIYPLIHQPAVTPIVSLYLKRSISPSQVVISSMPRI